MICFLRSGSWIASLNASMNSGSSEIVHLHIVDVQHAVMILFPPFHNTGVGIGLLIYSILPFLSKTRERAVVKTGFVIFAVQGADAANMNTPHRFGDDGPCLTRY